MNDHTEANVLVRAHPKIPHVAKARQFLIDVEDHMVEQSTTVMRQGCRMDLDLEGEAGQAMALGHIAR